MVKTPTTGQLIRSARDARGLTQAQVAKACGVTASAVTQWEADGTSPIRHLKALCRILQVSPAELGLIDTAGQELPGAALTAAEGPSLMVEQVQPIILPGGRPGLALLGAQGRTIVVEATSGLIAAMRVAMDSIEALLRR